MSEKIKSIKKYSFQFGQRSFGNWADVEDEPVLSSVTQYDEQGHLFEEIKYNSDGEIEERHHYKYDNAGRVVEYKMEMPLDEVEESTRTTRNEKGFATCIQKFYGDDGGEKRDFIYNNLDEVESISHYDEEGVLEQKEVLSYDDKKRLVKREVYDENNSLNKVTTFLYGDNDQPVEQNEFDSKNNLLSKVAFTYDDHGNEIKVLQTNEKGEKTTVIITQYDDLHRPVHRKSSGFYTRITQYAYDEKGNLTEESLSDENGMIITRSLHDYDENNRLAADAYYETDLTRAGRDTSLGSRYEYEFYT